MRAARPIALALLALSAAAAPIHAAGRSILSLERAEVDFDPRGAMPASRHGLILSTGRKLTFHLDDGRTLALPRSRYGIARGRTVKLHDDAALGGFVGPAQTIYDRLVSRGRVPLRTALTSITRAAKRTMAYDVSGVPADALARVQASGYRARGDETCKGTCGTSGDLIRGVLDVALDDPSIEVYSTASSLKGIAHDLTLVVDTRERRWVLVNSLSPLKPFDVVAKRQFPLLGRPLAPEE